MIRQRESEIVQLRKACHGSILRFCERGSPDVVPRARARESLCKFDAACAFPLRGIPKVEIHPGNVRFPAGRERNARIILGKGGRLPVVAVVRFQRAGHKIDAVRVYHGNKIQRRPLVQGAGGRSRDAAAVHIGACIPFQKLHKHGRRDPLVRVMRGIVAYLFFALSDGDAVDRFSHNARSDLSLPQKRIACRQTVNEQRQKRIRIVHVDRHDRKIQRHDQFRAQHKILCFDLGICRLNGVDGRIVHFCDIVQRISCAHDMDRISC